MRGHGQWRAVGRPRLPVAKTQAARSATHATVQHVDILLSLLGSLLAAIVGGLVVHLATRRRELEKDRRAERIKYLIASFRTIIRDLERVDEEGRSRFDTALEDVTLFGSVQQVELARRIRHFRQNSGAVDYGPLLESLRNDLRRELDLKPVPLFAEGEADY